MIKKRLMECDRCGSPYISLVQTTDEEKLYRCDACGLAWEESINGIIKNPEIKKCEKCGQINGPGAKVCQKCGQQIRYECPNCGSLIDLDATFCPYCEIHIQNYLEERKQRKAEENRARGLRQIQNLESEIQSLQNRIDLKDENIRQAHRKIETIRKTGGKLYYFGKTGLCEEENTIHTQVSSGIGCGTKAIALVLAVTVMDLSWQLFIGLAGTQYNSFEPYTFFQNESASTLYVIFCLSVFFALGVARLVYALIMMLSRQKAVNHLVSDEERWLRDLQAEKRELQNKMEILKRELVAAQSQTM